MEIVNISINYLLIFYAVTFSKATKIPMVKRQEPTKIQAGITDHSFLIHKYIKVIIYIYKLGIMLAI